MKNIVIVIMIIFGVAFVALSGCTDSSSTAGELVQSNDTNVVVAETTVAPTTATEETTVEPIITVTPKLYGVDFSFLEPVINDVQNLEVPLHYLYRINYFDTDKGVNLYLTFFAYNLDAVTEDFNPQTSDDVKSAGIPYKTRRDTIYYLNEKTVTVSLPGESSQGELDLSRPYNYGVVVEWTEN